MNKKINIGLLTLFMCFGHLKAREYRSPLSLYQGPMHFPFDREREVDEYNVDIRFFGGAYERDANDAFGPGKPNSLYCGKNLENYSAIYFGEPSFKIAQAFAGATVGGALPSNPFVSISTITENVIYRERGIWFGLQLGTRFGCDEHWHGGVRARLPYREIDVEKQCSGAGTIGGATGEILADVYQERQETNNFKNGDNVSNKVFAARLDFISALNLIDLTATGGTTPMVIYADPNSTNHLSIAGQDVTNNGVPTLSITAGGSPMAEAIDSLLMPTAQRWGNLTTNGVTQIAADGSGLSSGTRGYFDSAIDYAPLGVSVANQGKLFVVPSIASDTGNLFNSSQTIFSNISTAVSEITAKSALDFFDVVGVNDCDGLTQGIGDTDLEFYLARDWKNHDVYLEGQLGIKSPTGKKLANPLLLLQQPVGNNGHPEIRVGTTFLWDRLSFLKFRFDAQYSWVLTTKENVCASFVGSTVKNLGPSIPANVSWKYFVSNVDFTFVNPYNECAGWMIGYQVYDKAHDKVRFCSKTQTARDFLGQVKPLDPCVIEKQTHRISHKIRSELFVNVDCGKVFLGFTKVVAGKNIPREVDIHVGLEASF